MTKYMYLYTGGDMPDTPEGVEEMMAKWHAYAEKLAAGNHLVDFGAPFGENKQLAGAPASGVSGYSLIEADSLEQATALTDGHPHIVFHGGIEVLECHEM